MLALIAGICGDMGMCVVYLFIFAVMAWGAGVKKRWFLLAGSAMVIGFAVLWIFILPQHGGLGQPVPGQALPGAVRSLL